MCEKSDATRERLDASKVLLQSVIIVVDNLCKPIPLGPEWDYYIDRLEAIGARRQ